MTDSLPLGRIAGVRVGAHWSVLAILALITLGLAAGRFPDSVPERSWVAYLAAGLVTGLVFLLSLLAHEVSHAIVAQRNGMRVQGITLWLFGGVARLEGEPGSPGADLRIAGVGPAVSLVLGAVFFGVGTLAGTVWQAPLLLEALAWLAVINLVLAVFNLVPAAPLDGGRLLRAALWWRSGDQQRAAITAARAGQFFGVGLVGLGLLQVVLVGLSGLWMALIGWFLVNAARAEQYQAQQQQALSGVRVADVMSPHPMTAPPELTVDQFVDRYLMRHRFSAFPLVDSGRLTGLLTLNRVRQVPPEARAGTTLLDVACAPDEVPIARPGEALTQLLPRMAGCSDGRAVVLDDDGLVVGIVSPTDVARAVQVSRLHGNHTTSSA
jgi:Zn-dependent protease/CBS domain-containing protein